MAVTSQTRQRWRCRQEAAARGSSAPRGFTLIDILVSLAIIGVLISLLLPSLGAIRETTRKVVCASNVRQVGIGVLMYAEANRETMPYSRYAPIGNNPQAKPVLTMKLRITVPTEHFDGLGRLFEGEYLPAPGVFYCPSHRGEHRFDAYSSQWASLQGQIYGNYQYRGASPNGNTRFPVTGQRGFSLVTDGLTQTDYNHLVGSNVLMADGSLSWFEDQSKYFLTQLPAKDVDAMADQKVQDAWNQMDAKILGGPAPAP